MHVLVVEDDNAIAETLVELLEREGFETSRVAGVAQALAHEPTDLVLLDLGLPDGDGTEVCRQLRQRSSVPIIVLTARGSEDERVIGLELGADDYVVKPYGSRELVARIRTVLRRATGSEDAASRKVAAPQVIGPLEVDRRSRRVRACDEEVTCTPKEFGILAMLADDPGALVTRQELLDRVWGPHWYGPTKMIDVHVASLRKKLGHPEWIETVWGVGFRLVLGEVVEEEPE
jgi:two-component system response regulator RegX3